MDILIKKLRYMGTQYLAAQKARGGSGGPHYLTQAADTIEQQAEELTRLRAEVAERGKRIDELAEMLQVSQHERDELAAACEEKDEALQRLYDKCCSYGYGWIQETPIAIEVKNAISLTTPDALKAHDAERDAETLRKASRACEIPKPECCGHWQSDDHSFGPVCCGMPEPGEYMDGPECAEMLRRMADEIEGETKC